MTILLKENFFFILNVIIIGISLFNGTIYAQNANSVSGGTGGANNLTLQQNDISEIIRESSRRQPVTALNSSSNGPIQLSPRELEKSKRIDSLVRKLQKRDEQQSELSNKIQDLVTKIQPETNEILKKITQERKETLKEIRNKNQQEQKQESDRINTENRRKMAKYFKDVLKNLPQKGRHKDYTAYNKRFQPIVRK